LRYYGVEELLTILRRSCSLLNIGTANDASLAAIAARSRGTPRIANRLLRRVRDYAQVRAGGAVSEKVVDAALRLESVDGLGLDDLDRAYLKTIAGVYEGGPVGLEAVAATMNEDAGTLEDVVEPYLLQIGFLARTRRGRTLTRAAAEHLGLKWRPPAEPLRDLFDSAS
jgi:Holliday junction DNA helicase RuvB